MGAIVSIFYPFTIENRSEETIFYEYQDISNSDPEAKIEGELQPGEKHVNKNINAFKTFDITVVSSAEDLKNKKQSKQVGGGDRRISIFKDADTLEADKMARISIMQNLRSSISRRTPSGNLDKSVTQQTV